MTANENELLKTILAEMQNLKKSLKSELYRIGPKEFAKRMNISERTLWTRISDGTIKEPAKDGRLNYWLNDYVNDVVTQSINSDKVAA